MSAADKESGSSPGRLELTKLQREGIATRLAYNPVVEFMGIELLEVGVGHATLTLPHRGELDNSMGLVQGGVLAVLADVAGGVCLYSVLSDPLQVTIPTVEFKLNFLRPASQQDVIARGNVAHRGRQIAVCKVDVSTMNGTLLATGLFTYMVKNLSSAQLGRGETRDESFKCE